MININHLFQAAGFSLHDHVGQQHGKGFAAHQMSGAPDGMAEAQGFLLAGKAGLPGTRQILFENVEFQRLAALAQSRLQFILLVEMIFDQGFVAARDKDEMFNACGPRLIDNDLHQRPVNDGQHFFRHGLGGGQKAGAKTGNGEDSSADGTNHDFYQLLTDKQQVSGVLTFAPINCIKLAALISG